jgi:hypothetical protein
MADSPLVSRRVELIFRFLLAFVVTFFVILFGGIRSFFFYKLLALTWWQVALAALIGLCVGMFAISRK